MKIAVDFTPVENNPAGIGQYTVNLISKLIELDQENQYLIYSSQKFLLNNAENVVIRHDKHLPAKGFRWLWRMARDAKSRGVDIVISPSNQALAKLFPKTIQFIHDLALIKYPQFFKKALPLQHKLSTIVTLRDAYRVTVPSKTVKQELLAYSHHAAESRIEVIYPALNKWITHEPENEEEVLKKYNLYGKYILFVGTLEPRKNLVKLLEGYAKLSDSLKQNYRLIVVGKKGWYFTEIFERVSALALEQYVNFLGYVPNEDLSTLYKNATGFTYLSHYEGFGIPPLEAIYFQTPVLLSDIPVFREVYGDVADFVNTEDTQNIKLGLEALIKRDRLPKQLAEQMTSSYTWYNSAEKLLKIINENS